MEKYKYHTDQDQGKVSIPGTMVTWLLPDQDQGKVGWDHLRRGAHLSLFIVSFLGLYQYHVPW